MKFEDLKDLYLKKKKQFGAETYKHISELLKETKKIHKQDWSKNPTPNGDHEQSWRAFKGKNLKRLVQLIMENLDYIYQMWILLFTILKIVKF
jgi:type II restriction enzyme